MGPSDELSLIDAALTAIYSGGVSAYSIGGSSGSRSATKLDIDKLTKRKRELEKIITRQSASIFSVGRIGRTSR